MDPTSAVEAAQDILEDHPVESHPAVEAAVSDHGKYSPEREIFFIEIFSDYP